MFERCLYFNLNALARQVNRLWDQAFKPLGLSPSHAYTLRVILARPGLSQRDLGQELKLEKSTITRFVDALVEKSLVQRKAAENGRETALMPSAKARRLHKELEHQGDLLYQSLIDSLGKENLTSLVAQLRQAGKVVG